MNPSRVRQICALIPVAILIAVWIAFQPEGSWGQIFIFMAIIACGSWSAVFYSRLNSWSFFQAAIGMMFLLGAIGVAARGSFDTESYQRLGEVLLPYPRERVEHIQELSDRAQLRKGQTIWRLRSPDTVQQIEVFYQNNSFGEWQLIQDSDPIVLEKPGERMIIKIDASSGISTISYDYREWDED